MASATRRTTRVPVNGATALGPSRKATLTGRAAIVLLVLAVLAVSYASSVRAWLNQRSEINELSAQISERRAAVAELEQTKRRWEDPAYIEAQARLRFSWVMPGEIGYTVIDEDGSVLTGGRGLSEPVADREPVEEPEWWETSWASVVEAGVDPNADAGDTRDLRPKRTPLDSIGGPRRPPDEDPKRPLQ
ncbi:MAG: septum formation initiator family protein [Nocardioidaceae bacterium]|nr:septum formation initiator family protein [Nocardioidaceae bacterium]